MWLLRVAASTALTTMNAAVAAVSLAAGEKPGSLSGVFFNGKLLILSKLADCCFFSIRCLIGFRICPHKMHRQFHIGLPKIH